MAGTRYSFSSSQAHFWHADGHIEWNGNGPFVATWHAKVNAIRKAVPITGDADPSGAILFFKYDLKLPYAKD